MQSEDFETQLATLYEVLPRAARYWRCSDVEDVVQRAVMATWCKASTLVGEDAAVRYALAVLKKMIFKTSREQGRAPLPLVDHESGEAIDVAVQPPQETVIEAADALRRIEQMHEDVRRPVEAYVVGSSLAEIAAAYGLKLGTVKSRLHRALAQLRIDVDGHECWQLADGQGHRLAAMSRPVGTAARPRRRPARGVQPQATGVQETSGERDIPTLNASELNQVLWEKLQRWLRSAEAFPAPATWGLPSLDLFVGKRPSGPDDSGAAIGA